jgi:valyl-tRNA synthetase
VADLLADVNGEDEKMRFFPERWAKVYDHWLGGIQDWCISRQLWWGHRVPVWTKRVQLTEKNWTDELLPWGWDDFVGGNLDSVAAMRVLKTSDEKEFDFKKEPLNPVVAETEGEYEIAISTFDEELGRSLTKHGFTQDPDVLDTWFSSWLWPFATMGWPEKTDTLAKFYPTTDLVTGPDIIFFWVARMIMAGFEWMGEMPFRNVYFTGIIRDKQGRKMSKSLGNSPDPLDLITKFGADALRFGVMRSAPLGADILFDEKNVELGRNFCTKLWNAARFRQMQGGQSEGEINPALLTSDDKWILLRLDAAIREISAALDEYRFSDAANALYRFFWNEYCDWYLEASKAALGSADFQSASPDAKQHADRMSALRANTLAVIDFVLAHTLRLMHPFLPFITEELWHGLGFNADMPSDQGGRTIMYSHWPKPFDADFKTHYGLDESDEKFANAKYEVVNFGRGLRRDSNIASNKRVRFVFKPNAPLAAHDAEVLKILLNAEPFEVLEKNDAPNFSKGTPVALTPLGELFLPLEGLIDVEAERARLQKEIAKVDDELAKVRAKLADENFTAKVPAKVLDEHRQREAAWAAKLAQLQKMRDAIA